MYYFFKSFFKLLIVFFVVFFETTDPETILTLDEMPFLVVSLWSTEIALDVVVFPNLDLVVLRAAGKYLKIKYHLFSRYHLEFFY